MDLTSAFWYTMGIILLLAALQILARPLEIILRAVGSSIVGGAALWVLNTVGGLVGLHLALNPISAAVVGLLGIPGVVSLALMRFILS